jgi:hypothetical protein
MHRIYTAEALSNAPSTGRLIINNLKVKKATNIPQYGEVILKSRQNSCLPAAIPSVKSKPAAIVSQHVLKRIATAEALKRVKSCMKYFINVITASVRSYLNLRLVYFQIILFFTFSATSFANTEFTFNPKNRIETVIGANELNRIGVVGGEIIEVIGDENKYALYWSGDWRNLFIKPKAEVGETIELSLIMPHGGAQDMRFTVGDTSAQTIFINLGSELKSSPPINDVTILANTQLKSEIASMMRSMIGGEKGKYYVVGSKRTLHKTKERLVTQNVAYRYRNLSGAVLSVKNLTSKPIELLELDFSNLFKNTVAINLGTYNGNALNVIKPRATMQVFIITREIKHD